ncbi:prepilin peptidase, partial [Amycolatopsis rubida]
MVLTAVLAAGAVVPVLLVMTKRAGAPVSAVIGMTTALAAAAVAACRADAGALPAWWLPVAWLVSVLGAPLALADARHRRLPDVLTLPAYPAVALTLTLAALSGGGWRLGVGALLGCLLFGGTHLIVHRLSPGGLGPGDVKLAGSFGAVLGAVGGLAPAAAAVLAALVSLAAVVPMWLMRRIRRAGSPARPLAPPLSVTPAPPPVTDPTVASSLRPEAEGGLHEPTPSQSDSPPLAADLAQPSTPTAASSTLTDSSAAAPSAPPTPAVALAPPAPVLAPSAAGAAPPAPALAPPAVALASPAAGAAPPGPALAPPGAAPPAP